MAIANRVGILRFNERTKNLPLMLAIVPLRTVCDRTARHPPLTCGDISWVGCIVPGDALAVINSINAFGSAKVPAGAAARSPFYDANTDGTRVPDVLAIMNDAAARSRCKNEGKPTTCLGFSAVSSERHQTTFFVSVRPIAWPKNCRPGTAAGFTVYPSGREARAAERLGEVWGRAWAVL